MILVAAALACVLSVPLTGGRLAGIAELDFRWSWAALAALALQVSIITVAPNGAPGLHAGLHLASYGLAGACLYANRNVRGLPLLALGAGLNALAIALNGGVMPASARAMQLAGVPPSPHFANSAAVDHPTLLAIGDIIPVPGPWPLGNVLSVGDLLITAGLLVILHRAARVPPAPSGASQLAPSPRPPGS